MKAGRIEQFDTPEQVFEEPGHRVRRRLHRHVQPAAARAPRRGLVARASSRRTGELPVPRDCASVAVRLRPDDIVLAPVDQAFERTDRWIPGRGRRLAVRGAPLRRRRHRRWAPPRGAGAERPPRRMGAASCRSASRSRPGSPRPRRSTSTVPARASPATCPSRPLRQSEPDDHGVPGHAGRSWPLLRWRSVARICGRFECL